MAWLSELLKALTGSKLFTGAVFVASLSLLILPRLLPLYVDPVPQQWRWLVDGICVFSAALLVFWFTNAIGKAVARVPSALRGAPRPRDLNGLERGFLVYMGSNYPNDALSIDNLDHSRVSKLEYLQMCKGLEEAGLIQVKPYSDNLVSLTQIGRQKALELSRQGNA